MSVSVVGRIAVVPRKVCSDARGTLVARDAFCVRDKRAQQKQKADAHQMHNSQAHRLGKKKESPILLRSTSQATLSRVMTAVYGALHS